MASRITCHIATAAGARFSEHKDQEDLRTSLIEYFNEVHADCTSDELHEDATLEEVIDAIEEIEDVSWEEIWDTPTDEDSIEERAARQMLNPRERDTVLAALRLWQHALDGNVILTGEGNLIELQEEISFGDHNQPLDANEIDALCERLNT